MIRSKFKIGFIIWFLFMMTLLIGVIWFLIRTARDLIFLETDFTSYLIGLILLFLFVVLTGALKEFKYILIDEKERQVKWYSILLPFGKKIDLNNYVGLMKTTEYSASGKSTSLYLIDDNWTTAGKINGLFYSNFDEILSSINLKELKNKNHGFINYFKLLYTGRVKIKK